MTGIVFIVSLVTFAIVFREIRCLSHVNLTIEPRIVEYGKTSTLKCSYDVKKEQLYTVKWYRGQYEFYRFTPKEHPSTKIFHTDGIVVDVSSSQSNEHQVVLRDIGFNLSGNFSCEVTIDEPYLKAVTVVKDMIVVVLPRNPPSLATDKTFYEVGDVLRANCSSPASRPAATLTFILNNIVVCERCTTYKRPQKDLFRSESSIEIRVFSSHFHNGRITLKCVAQIGDLYQQDTEITFNNVKDPVPARVTQTSVSCRLGQLTASLWLLTMWLFFRNFG
ncbi:uncharacterized protein LOC126745567 [Anthonomus grandis grandis]|uniref:uncharacterized protein LOC126745567 n=1 Tax=Anthonomus grandis grandis TaxID=2921223 RepID=UPI00216648C1|nr:uncharacterized protein LOC126745567 [Anthonomus grandis grandis]